MASITAVATALHSVLGAPPGAPGWSNEKPIYYFHVVFTLPAEARVDIALQNKAAAYRLLFQATSATTTPITADPKHLGARVGITAMLHTCGSGMTQHPPIHMIVPDSRLSPNGNRIAWSSVLR